MLSENHDAPQIFGAVIVKAGSKNDPADATGIAHYLEHMLFKGTQELGTTDWKSEKPLLDRISLLYEDLSRTKDKNERILIQKEINDLSKRAGDYSIPNELDRILTSMGSTNLNAFTTDEMTVYHNAFPANQVSKWLDVYSHRFQTPVFRLFQSELETVYEEKNRALDNTFYQVFETFNKNLYKKHPYGQQTTLGTVEHLKNPSLKKMYDFYNTYYVANNMALVLSGDFNSEQMILLIKEKFGKLRAGEIPEYVPVREDTLVNRHLVKVKMTPVSVGILGYRTVSYGHPDLPVCEVINNLLSNEAACGMIDKLKLEGKILECGLMPVTMNEYGSTVIYFIPKILGQGLEKSERLVRAKIEKLRIGEYDDALLAAVKLNLIGKAQEKWEENESRVMEMVQSFSEGIDWGKYVKYEEAIGKVTREDIKRVAELYYNHSFLAMHSKMGFPKKEKLQKPGYDPILSKNEEKSPYRQAWEKIPSNAAQPRFVDFTRDVKVENLAKGCDLKYVKNPVNDIFTLKLKFGKGGMKDPVLPYAADYFNLVGIPGIEGSKFKEALYKTGCTLNFYADDEAFYCELTGLETGIEEAFKLMTSFLKNPDTDNKMAGKMRNDVKTQRKLERAEPDGIADALQEYVCFGKNSSYLREISDKKLGGYSAKELIKHYRGIYEYEMDVYFVGKKPIEDIRAMFSQYFDFPAVIYPKTKTIVLDRVFPDETTIYFIEKKGAVQSHIYFNEKGKVANLKDEALIRAFNLYFGGDMSSIVFQQIREFRSLAYSTWAKYYSSPLAGKTNHFTGFIGCQGDKTLEATESMIKLIRTMPLYHERMEDIRSALLEKANSSRPSFREIAETIEAWVEKGFTRDPNEMLQTEFKDMDFGMMVAFYQKEIAKKPLAITIVGDPANFDIYALMKYGTLELVKEKQIFAK